MIKKLTRYFISAEFLIPLLVFILAKTFSVFVSKAANCPGFGELCWSRWDSGLYMQIAETGRDLIHCENPAEWCGKAGWMPLYPWLIKFFSWLFNASLPTVGIWISNICFFFLLLVTAKLTDIKKHNLKAYLLLLLCAFAPGSIYYFAIFPMSLLALLIALCFYQIKRKQYIAAGAFAGLAVLTYSIGFILIASLLGFILFEILILKNKSKLLYFTALIPSLTFGGILIHDHFALGHWNAMFLIQYKYGYSIQSPFLMLKETIKLFREKIHDQESWKYLQNIILFFYFILFALWQAILSLKNKNSFNALAAFSGLFFWFVPFSLGTNVGLYRNVSALGFIHPVYNRISTLLSVIVLIVFLVLDWYLGKLFTYSILI